MAESFRNINLTIKNNVYGLAFAALVHPDELEKYKGGKHAPRVDLLNDERESLFLSAMLVTMAQLTTMYLINLFFETIDGESKFICYWKCTQ